LDDTKSAAVKPSPKLPAWGEVTDPDGDCQLKLADSKLSIVVPGTAHDLSAELKKVNAPRVLRDVQGDFIVQVKVGGALKPGPNPSMPQRLPFNSAGLLVWLDSTSYVRLERAAIVRDGNVQPILLFEERNKSVPVMVGAIPLEPRPTYLRLERRDGFLFASFGFDGTAWVPLKPVRRDLPEKVKVGVAAVNTAAEPFTAELESFALYARVVEQP
jgi:regulation of enolase protein 1 (concanavalin A-like superfamily)